MSSLFLVMSSSLNVSSCFTCFSTLLHERFKGDHTVQRSFQRTVYCSSLEAPLRSHSWPLVSRRFSRTRNSMPPSQLQFVSSFRVAPGWSNPISSTALQRHTCLLEYSSSIFMIWLECAGVKEALGGLSTFTELWLIRAGWECFWDSEGL